MPCFVTWLLLSVFVFVFVLAVLAQRCLVSLKSFNSMEVEKNLKSIREQPQGHGWSQSFDNVCGVCIQASL